MMEVRVVDDVMSEQSGIEADALQMKLRRMTGGGVARRKQSEAR